jgi:hypothetical protein
VLAGDEVWSEIGMPEPEAAGTGGRSDPAPNGCGARRAPRALRSGRLCRRAWTATSSASLNASAAECDRFAGEAVRDVGAVG